MLAIHETGHPWASLLVTELVLPPFGNLGPVVLGLGLPCLWSPSGSLGANLSERMAWLVREAKPTQPGTVCRGKPLARHGRTPAERSLGPTRNRCYGSGACGAWCVMVAMYTQQWFSWALRCLLVDTKTEWNLSCASALATCSRLGLLGRLPAWPERTVSACRSGRGSHGVPDPRAYGVNTLGPRQRGLRLPSAVDVLNSR